MSEGTAHYAHEDGTWILRFSGDVRHPLSPAVNALLDRAFADPGLKHVVVDLSQTETIDSTNLGVLARLANELATRGLPRPTLIAPGADIQTILRSVCFDRVFHVVTPPCTLEPALHDLPGLTMDERGMLRLVLAAHRRLCALDEQNRTLFREVTELLERELHQ